MKLYTGQLVAYAKIGFVSNIIVYPMNPTPEQLGPEMDLADEDLIVGNKGVWMPYTPKYRGLLYLGEKGWVKHKALFKSVYAQDAGKRPNPDRWVVMSWGEYEARMDALFADIKAKIPAQIAKAQQRIDQLQAQQAAMRTLL